MDVDHMVPLRNAHNSGAWAWTAERKRLYANYLDDPQHLIAVTASANRSKGARGPEDWKPDDTTYWCQYAIDWITVKDNWDLTVTLREIDALTGMLDTCANPPDLQLLQGGTPILPRPTNGPHYPTSTPTARTYSSCDAAQAAGEPRAQGSKGSGRGFPKWMVPSARDGDGDGVVCRAITSLQWLRPSSPPSLINHATRQTPRCDAGPPDGSTPGKSTTTRTTRNHCKNQWTTSIRDSTGHAISAHEGP